MQREKVITLLFICMRKLSYLLVYITVLWQEWKVLLVCVFPCVVCAEPETECYSGKGTGYRGMVGTTESGAQCLPWDSALLYDELHVGTVVASSLRGLGDHAYCRLVLRNSPICQSFFISTNKTLSTQDITYFWVCNALYDTVLLVYWTNNN